MRAQPANAPRYRKDLVPELDGLRAIAALLVLLTHLPTFSLGPELFEFYKWVSPGAAGVDLFFVLSGFLITRILLVERELGVPLRQFLLRRCLRIFPIYYLTLIIVGNQLGTLETLALATYTANFAFIFKDATSIMEHAWSLAVEEHFYLVWPPLVAFLAPSTSRRIVLNCVLPLALVSVAGAVALGDWGRHGHELESFILHSSTTKCFSLGLGALVAYHEGWVRAHRARVLASSAGLALLYVLLSPRGLAATGLDGALQALPSGTKDPNWVALPVLVFAVPCLSLALVLSAVAFTGSSWPHSVLLRLPLLRSIGRISYGVYLYHFPIFVTPGIWGPNPAHPPLSRVLCVLALCFGVATVSYRFIELPLLRIGARFRSAPRPGRAAAPEPKALGPLRVGVYALVVALFAAGTRALVSGSGGTAGGARAADWAVAHVPIPARSIDRAERLARKSASSTSTSATASVRTLERAAREHDPRLGSALELVFFCAGVQAELADRAPLVACHMDSPRGRFLIDLAYLDRARAWQPADSDLAGGELAVSYVLAAGVASALQEDILALYGGSSDVDEDGATRALRAKLQADFVAGVLLSRSDASPPPGDRASDAAVRSAREVLERTASEAPRGWRARDRLLSGTLEQSQRWFRLGLTTRDLARAAEAYSVPRAAL